MKFERVRSSTEFRFFDEIFFSGNRRSTINLGTSRTSTREKNRRIRKTTERHRRRGQTRKIRRDEEIFIFESFSLQFEEAMGSYPDPSLPVSHQLEQALKIIHENIHLLMEAKIQHQLVEKVRRIEFVSSFSFHLFLFFQEIDRTHRKSSRFRKRHFSSRQSYSRTSITVTDDDHSRHR